MFGIGGFELLLILIFGFLIFGPDKLPAIAQTIGKGIAKFRNAQEEMKDTLSKNAFVDKESDEPFKNPLTVIESAASEAKKDTKEAKEKVEAASAVASQKISEKSASFAERKAAYDRERAARKAAEKEAAEAAKAAEEKAKENPRSEVAHKQVSEAVDTKASDAKTEKPNGMPDAKVGKSSKVSDQKADVGPNGEPDLKTGEAADSKAGE